MSQGPRTRAIDAHGRKVKGVYVRDGRFIVGFQRGDKWVMRTLEADSLAEARMEREKIISLLRTSKKKSVPTKELDQVYSDARKLSQQLSLLKPKIQRELRRELSKAEFLVMQATDLIFDVWKKS